MYVSFLCFTFVRFGALFGLLGSLRLLLAEDTLVPDSDRGDKNGRESSSAERILED